MSSSSDSNIVSCCSRCDSKRLFSINLGFKVERSEFSIAYQKKCSEKHRFWRMEKESPFHDPTNQNDAVIELCLECGQTQGKFPASSPFVSLNGGPVRNEDEDEEAEGDERDQEEGYEST